MHLGNMLVLKVLVCPYFGLRVSYIVTALLILLFTGYSNVSFAVPAYRILMLLSKQSCSSSTELLLVLCFFLMHLFGQLLWNILFSALLLLLILFRRPNSFIDVFLY